MSDKSENLRIAATDLYEAMSQREPMTMLDSVPAIFGPYYTEELLTAAASLAIVASWGDPDTPANPVLEYDYAAYERPLDVSRDGAVHGHVVVDPWLAPYGGVSPIVGFQPVIINCTVADAVAAVAGNVSDSLRAAQVTGAGDEMFNPDTLAETFAATPARINVWSLRCVDLVNYAVNKAKSSEDYRNMHENIRTAIERFHAAFAEWAAPVRMGDLIESADDPRITALPVGSILRDLDDDDMEKTATGEWKGTGGITIESPGCGPWTVHRIGKENE